jgi:predicted transposase/invertase (TIGR01784 family)
MLGMKGCEPQLQELLNALLRQSGRAMLCSVEIVENTTLPAEIIGGKKSILDVRALLADQTKINIEVQLTNEYNMDKRSLFYWSREFGKGIVAGGDYQDLPQVIAINILGFKYFPLKRYHTSFHLREDVDRDFILTEALEIHFLDMVRFRALTDKDLSGNAEHRWLSYLDSRTPGKKVEELIKMDAGIAKAQEIMDKISQDEGLLHAYQMYEMTLSDETTRINGALRKGRKEKALQIARKLKIRGYPVDEIAEDTGLSSEEVAAL